ncbi:bile acid-transporting ATPase YBT1 [Ascoidea rubescens DSM 1968]|uniref:ABC transporter n=1 Tax=Ascoidea rubescens DSM 1968 TaxID=1344418 RepID=A0A1D2VCM3_9ASCO|nr:ABC transporter [Ascoidea rubescens DSM 1968]ODV59385.1 ABC transporter [Ascoidea rubescens DSM 1968]
MDSSLSLNCSAIWYHDDFTSCARKYYLDISISSSIIIIVISCLLYSFFHNESFTEKQNFFNPKLSSNSKSDKVDADNHHGHPLLVSSSSSFSSSSIKSTSSNYGAINSNRLSADLIKRKHFDIKFLSFTNDDGAPHGEYIEIHRNFIENFKVFLEYFLILIGFITNIYSYKKNISSLETFLVWLISLFLSSLRFYSLIISKKNNTSFLAKINSWALLITIHTVLLVPTSLNFRSVLIHNTLKNPQRYYYCSQFPINFCLSAFFWTDKIGNNVSNYLYNPKNQKNYTPTPERITSLFSLITYSWLNPMISIASKNKDLKLDQIWALRNDDFSYITLRRYEHFEKFKSRLSFAWKLMSYFGWDFAFQAFYITFYAFGMFVPSILLKVILEFIDDSNYIPLNLAWFSVFLMFGVRVLNSLLFGVSLFIGRRVCTRMRSIIIGQVYSKALRRKLSVEKSIPNDDSKSNKSSKVSKQTQNAEENGEQVDNEKKKEKELGGIINLMAVDAFQVSELCGYLFYFVSGVVMVVFAIYLLYDLLGWSSLVGSTFLLFLLPINYLLSKKIGDLQKNMMLVSDKRVGKLNECFQNIRIIKFFAWEQKFIESIMDIRMTELKKLKRQYILQMFSSILGHIAPTIVTLISFACYTLIDGNVLTSPVAFTALSFFNLLRLPIDDISYMLSSVMRSKASLDRIQDFFSEPETTKYEQLICERDANSPLIGFQNATFSWNGEEDLDDNNDFKLRDLDISFVEGKLNVIIGPTGAGKTSTLLALLGEMNLISGKVFLPGVLPRNEIQIEPNTGLADNVAYCSQSAWLLNGTIRDNILFDSEFNQKRYKDVIESCGLKRDLEIFEAGDQTEIGEKGVVLSGGQKQRVSLARALYSSSKNILLDDCLSAVDSNTALWIYDNCITGPLMKNRTCILVSHNVALTVKDAEHVIVMENGRVRAQGSPEKLLFDGFLGEDDLIKSSIMNSRNASNVDIKQLNSSASRSENQLSNRNIKKFDKELLKAKVKEQEEEEGIELTKAVNKTKGKLVQEETKSTGTVSIQVYKFYMNTFGPWYAWGFVFSLFIFSQVVFISQSWWLRKWSLNNEAEFPYSSFHSFVISPNIFEKVNHIKDKSSAIIYGTKNFAQSLRIEPGHDAIFYISIYGLIGLGFGLVCSIRNLFLFFSGLRASNIIFKNVLERIMRAKLRFFDTTPIGRIMNRFSKDIESVDQEITEYFQGTFVCIIITVSTLFLIITITPLFFLFAVFISLMFYAIGYFYLSLSRELKRYESITKSPIHQNFTETLVGVTTIRAYGVEHKFMKKNLEYIDENNTPFFYLWVANRWLCFRIDFLGALVTLFSGSFVLYYMDSLDAGLAGISLSYAISFADAALWLVRLYAMLEMIMNSVERLKEYMEVEEEPEPQLSQEFEPPKTWPETGKIEISNLSLRYAPDLPKVIKNVTFDVEPNAKIGIVGRTGAGKSTIITALFRFLDPDTGTITIDGYEITKIGLNTLRKAITIIPQDPTLFSGTIKSNLDPFEQYSDAEMFEALIRVNLLSREELESNGTIENDELISRTPNNAEETEIEENKNKFLNLDNKIEEGGKNLSQGQRQLVCLARSILRTPKIMLLDEATASIDYKSDHKIQQTIRNEFKNSTILTIAHRLRSIIDYDKILVMDAGKVVEYDEPFKLISDKNTIFYQMCEKSGELDVLIKLAKESSSKNEDI